VVFLGLAVPALMLIFSAQIWAVSQGIVLRRSLSEFASYGSPIWGYVLPTRLHPMFAVFPVNSYNPVGYPDVECAAYLGVVTLLLIGYAAFHRGTFPGSRFWWLAFGGLAVLSMGAYWRVGSHKIPMPGLWLRAYVPIFQSIRVPARFNLLVCGIGAVLAGSGLVRLLARFRTPWGRGAVFGSAIILLVADMNMVPFMTDTIRPTMPACYAWIRERNPRAALLEAPALPSWSGLPLTSTCGYWQSSHRMSTSAGYSSFPNTAFDDLIVDDSPISGISLLNPDRLAKPDSLAIGILPKMSFTDYIWMITTRNRFDYILLHRWDDTINERLPAFQKLVALLRHALVFEDANTLVYDVKKLAAPSRPVVLCETGWRIWRERLGPAMRVVEKTGQIGLYIPESGGSPVLSIDARSYLHPRQVVLRSGDITLARWEISHGPVRTFTTPPLALPAGMHSLTLESDAEERPRHLPDQSASWDAHKYSLQVYRLEVRAANP
jgi:hypothetical protein